MRHIEAWKLQLLTTNFFTIYECLVSLNGWDSEKFRLYCLHTEVFGVTDVLLTQWFLILSTSKQSTWLLLCNKDKIAILSRAILFERNCCLIFQYRLISNVNLQHSAIVIAKWIALKVSKTIVNDSNFRTQWRVPPVVE